jgi:hypothetical protein
MWAFTLAFEFRLEKPQGTPLFSSVLNVAIAAFGLQPIFAMLMPRKHRVLSFKPQLRFEWRGQGGQNKTEQPDHSASLGDSIT